jgi:F0F1-type ATP synthase delta subunit
MFIIPLIVLLVIIFTVMVIFLRNILNRNLGTATAHLDHMAAEYSKKEQEVKKQYEDAKRQSQEIVIIAQKEAQQQKETIVKEAEAQKEKILSDAQAKVDEMIQQADRARNALLAELTDKIEEKAIVRAVTLLSEALPEHIRKEIHGHWLDDLVSSSFEQLDRLHIPEGVSDAKIVSAFSLTEKQKEGIKSKIKERLKRDINLTEEVDSGIIAGLVVHIGSLVLDGSLKFKIQGVARDSRSKI